MKAAVCAALMLLVNGNPNLVPTPKLCEDFLDRQKVYLIYRGTRSKEGRLVTKFNIADRSATHVGILLSIDGRWKVAHIDNSVFAKGFAIHQPNKFLSPVHGTFSAGVWEICTSGNFTRERLGRYLDSISKEQIGFDLAFARQPENRMYCSELIANALAKNGFPNRVPLYKRALSGIERAYFNRDSLEYYPVDAFQYVAGITWVNAIK